MFSAQSFTTLRISTDSAHCIGFVKLSVCNAGANDKITKSIVGSIFIFVMHKFRWFKWTPQFPTHYQTVFLNVAVMIRVRVIWLKNKHVTIVNESLRLTGWVPVAMFGVKTLTASQASWSRFSWLIPIPHFSAFNAFSFACFHGGYDA